MPTIPTPIATTVVTCRVASEALALAASVVRDTLERGEVTRVPGAPAAFDGLVPWRGQLVPVLNVARRLGVAASGPGVIAIVELDGEPVGLRLDGVDETPVPYEPDHMTLVDVAALVAAPEGMDGRGAEPQPPRNRVC
jgi:purine-binding chemotaxis protein CheW